MSYHSVEEIISRCKEQKITFYEAILLEDCHDRGVTKEQSKETMLHMWRAMVDSTNSYERNRKSRSGLVGDEGGRMEDYRKENDPLCGDFVSKVMMRALQMGGNNACMKRIVAAPTAGACGVLPAVLTTFEDKYQVGEEKLVEALYVAAGIGQVIAERAFIAGAAGGCQAEIGSASSMAAAALVYLRGGNAEQMSTASGIALKNLLGLVCDPVGGLVEVHCVKRNVIGAVNALSSADMALAGITSAIPTDQVIDAMRTVGESMDESLRETGKGGLAGTKRAKEIVRELDFL